MKKSVKTERQKYFEAVGQPEFLLEAGKFYRALNGYRIGPVKKITWERYTGRVEGAYVVYSREGLVEHDGAGRVDRHSPTYRHPFDLVAEWTDEPQSAPLEPSGVLLKNGTPVGGKAEPAPAEALDALLEEREKAHGEFWHTADISQKLKDVVATSAPGDLDNTYCEALHMICSKIARILSGNPHEVDHWRDIAGYARLGERFARAKSDA